MPDRIPTREDWGDLDDLDIRHGHRRYGGKAIEEAMPLFVENPIERLSELQCAPAIIFNYYIRCYVDFLSSERSRGESDCASSFLSLVLYRAQNDAQSLAPIKDDLLQAVNRVASRQDFYEASHDIYGSFLDRERQIKACLSNHDA